MAAEWTHHVSYGPTLIAINVRGDDATAENITHSKEFGVNLAADDQNILCSLGGRYTGIGFRQDENFRAVTKVGDFYTRFVDAFEYSRYATT